MFVADSWVQAKCLLLVSRLLVRLRSEQLWICPEESSRCLCTLDPVKTEVYSGVERIYIKCGPALSLPPLPFPSEAAVKEYLMQMRRWRRWLRGQKEWDISVASRANGCYFTPTLSTTFLYTTYRCSNVFTAPRGNRNPRVTSGVGWGSWFFLYMCSWAFLKVAYLSKELML